MLTLIFSTSEIWIKTQFIDLHQSLLNCGMVKESHRAIRIAVLDTGFAVSQREKESLRGRVVWRDFVEPENTDFWKDEDATTIKLGHGTSIVFLLLKLIPRAKIYVCRIAKTRDDYFPAHAGTAIAKVSLGVLQLK